ncbi:hypothetical protein GW765_03690 [Candidatus Parcubacteria bacterium]|nr:hypothetical protein [Candidatus Parcubacteria bacterium]
MTRLEFVGLKSQIIHTLQGKKSERQLTDITYCVCLTGSIILGACANGRYFSVMAVFLFSYLIVRYVTVEGIYKTLYKEDILIKKLEDSWGKMSIQEFLDLPECEYLFKKEK